MLKKLPELEIDPANPFQNDQLKRKESAENLTRLISTISDPFVLSLSSPWGTGKTTFIRMWSALLRNQGHYSLHFNAWETDFSGNPLTSFIGEIERLIEENPVREQHKNKIKKHVKKIKEKGAALLHAVGPAAVRLATLNVLDAEEVKKIADFSSSSDKEITKLLGKLAEDRLKQYEQEKTAISGFKKHLEELVDDISRGENGVKLPVVIFVDELDRCRPSYAIELLENIKHLFSARGFLFVLVIDKRQLENSVKALYGADIDAPEYLRRFIDLEYKLPDASALYYAPYLYERFRLDDVLRNFPSSSTFKDALISMFSKTAELFDLSLRTQEQCFIVLNVVLRMMIHTSVAPLHCLVFLITLKAKNPELYLRFNKRTVSYANVREFLNECRDGKGFLRDNLGIVIDTYLKHAFLHLDKLSEVYQQTSNQLNSTRDRDEIRKMQPALSILESMLRASGNLHSSLVRQIEFAERFEPITTEQA